jgi:O-antigen ligase
MRTIENYGEDSSAQGRIRAWKAAFAMAVTRPLGVGAGNFNSAYGRYYMPQDAQGWGTARWISAHSVYFKILGELGFPGLLLLCAVLFTNLRDHWRIVRLIRANPSRYDLQEQWPGLLAVGVMGYGVGGIFLGGVTYPHIFLLTGLTVACRRHVESVEPVGETAAAAVPVEEPVRPRVRPALPVQHQNPTPSASVVTSRYAHFNRSSRRAR